MKVFTSCSDNYLAVFDKFHKSFISSGLDPADLKVDTWTMPEGKNGFKTLNWYHALRTKMEFFKKELSDLPMDEIALFMDCDIQMFPNAPTAISTIQGIMLNKDLTFMFMREGKRDEVNGGLFFARNNRASRLVMNVVCKELNKDDPPEYGEQTVFNRLLQTSCFRWDYVPYQYVIWAKDIHQECHQVAFHHAVCSHTVESKLEQMQEISDIVSQRCHAHSTQMANREAGHQIVFCRCHESLQSCEEWIGKNTLVYNKNEDESLESFIPDCLVMPLSNVGRAPHAFLHHICENYDNLAEVTVFVPGAIDVKPILPLDTYVKTATFCALVYSVGSGFMHCDRWTQGEDVGYGYVNTPGIKQKLQQSQMLGAPLSIGEFYDSLCRERPDTGRCITLGPGPFSVTREVIRKRPKEQYLSMLKMLVGHRDPEVSHFFEKCWYHIFMGPRSPDHISKPGNGYYSVTDNPERITVT